jgi:(R,R)-butanediol dehydrogenase/meso-butanediol dehydrogenase/diacetyl reductase
MTDGNGSMECPAGVVLGHEYAGEVVAIGRDVKTIRVGDRVTALAMPACGRCDSCARGELMWCTGDEKLFALTGGFAEYICVGEPAVMRLHEALSWEQGALVEPLAVARHGVELADPDSGQRVAILGAGPIAMATLYWLRERGLSDVLVVARSTQRKQYAMDLGARSFDVLDDDAIDGVNAEIVFEAAGTVGALTSALALTAKRGMVVSYGFCDEPDAFVPATALMKEVSIQFAMMYSRHDFEETICSLATSPSDPMTMVSEIVPLDRLPLSFEALRGPNQQCKVMIDPWG